MELSLQDKAAILDVARTVIRAALAGAEPEPADPREPLLRKPAGCFVSLHSIPDHRLRGCVGRVEANQALFESLRSSAAHVLEDPRFACDPVRLAELPGLEIEVSVLSPPRPTTASGFDLCRDGIVLGCGGRTGCFLPQVARETGWTREQLLDRLCTEKLGLPARSWQLPAARLQAFSVLVIGPEPFEGA